MALTTPPPPGLQEATKNSTIAWQEHLESLFHHAKDRFPDVVWELTADDEDPGQLVEEVWGHKAIVYARAPPSFQSRYFSVRPHGASSPLPYSSSPPGPNYLADSAVSLDAPDHSNGVTPRTPSPFRAASPSTFAAPSMAPSALLRITKSINSSLFSNELEYLYTGKGFGEAFEFLFDESREHALTIGSSDDAEALRIDKLRKDLVFMWRSRLYSDVRISLTGNFSGSHENTTAIFSSHRFILVSRSSHFHTELLGWPNKSALTRTDGDPPTITLPSPPFTPASLHFTLGFIYTGTLVFSHRSYDLATAFAILRAALYLALPTLHDEIQARIVQEMMHGLFHAFISFEEYDRLTAGRWGTGGCRCRQCARRVPRVLEFATADDVKNQVLERGARRALVGLFGEGWCNSDFASLSQKVRESALKGLSKRTTVQNAFPLLFAAEHALAKLASQIEPWADTVKDMIFMARKAIDDILAREAEVCFNKEEWMEIMENDGGRFEDGERVEWTMAAVLRGVKEPFAPSLYQVLVSAILLRPHPTEVDAPQLSATSHIRVQVEQTRLELLKWIGHKWLAIRHERGFDPLDGWALKEISDHIEVPVEDLLNPPASKGFGASGSSRRAPSGLLLRPISNHPHTSKIDADSEAASSMRASVLSRSLALREHDRHVQPSAGSIRSVTRSTASRATTSTVPASQITSRKEPGSGISPAKRLANHVRAKDKAKERPDSKLTPSIIEPEGENYVDEGESEYGYRGWDREGEEYDRESDDGISDREEHDDRISLNDSKTEQHSEELKYSRVHPQSKRTPVKKVLITRASLASVKSAANDLKSSSASIKSQSTFRSSAFSPTSSVTNSPRPDSRDSTRSSRLNLSVTGVGPRARPISRPVSRLSTTSTSVGGSTRGFSRPISSVSTATTTTTDTVSTFCTATNGSILSTPTATRSRRPSAVSSVLLPAQRSSSGSPFVQERARKLSGASVSSIASNAGSVCSKTPAGTRGKRTAPSGTESGNLIPSSANAKESPQPIHVSTSKSSVTSAVSTVSTGSGKKPAPVGTLGRKSIAEKKSFESIASRPAPTPLVPVPVSGLPTQTKERDKFNHGESEKDNLLATEQSISELPPPSSSSSSAGTIRMQTVPDTANEHKKTNSSASTSSVATLKRKASTDTIKTLKSSFNDSATTTAIAPRPVSKALPLPPTEVTQSPVTTYSPLSYQPTSIERVLSEYIPRGDTLDVGIPCIISSKRKRFKAYARYIGEVEGEAGPWVGVEVPMPIGDTWGDNDNTNKFADDRQWHDGSWGGIRYFGIGSMGSEMDYGDDRAFRRRRLDVSSGSLSESYFGRADGKGLLKREGDQLSITSDRIKRMRSVSPAVSDMSGTESRGLFVRPSQVLYVVDAVGVDL